MPYRRLQEELTTLAQAVGSEPCGVAEVSSLAESAATVLNHQHGFGNRYVFQLHQMLTDSMLLAHSGTVDSSILFRMAALLDEAEAAPPSITMAPALITRAPPEVGSLDWALPAAPRH